MVHKLTDIRVKNKSTVKQKVISIVSASMLGIVLGLLAKIVDNPAYFSPIFTNIGDRLGIWVFVAALISVFSYSPALAAVKGLAFFGSMLIVYYLYTTLFLHFFPAREMIFWSICAVITPVCAYVMWYARGNSFLSAVITALPIIILLAEGFALGNAYLRVHTHYYLIPWLIGIYFLMIIVLLLIVPKNKTQLLIILPLSLLLSFILIKLNTYYGFWQYI